PEARPVVFQRYHTIMGLELFSSGAAPCGQVDDIALQFATADPPIRAKIASLSRWTFWKNNAARVAGIDDNPGEPRILGESAPDGPFHGVAVLSGEGPMAWVHQDVDLCSDIPSCWKKARSRLVMACATRAFWAATCCSILVPLQRGGIDRGAVVH